MRLLVLTAAAVSVFSASSFAAKAKANSPANSTTNTTTVLHVPLFVEQSYGDPSSPDYRYIPVSEFNKTLTAKGLEARLEAFDLKVGDRPDVTAEQDKLDAEIQKLGLQHLQAFGELFPAQFSSGAVETCYRGDGNQVVDIVFNNTDNLYSEQMTLLAWRLGKKTVYGDNFDESDPDSISYLSENSKAWANYDTSSDTVLMLSSVGDGGDDVEESIIPRCK